MSNLKARAEIREASRERMRLLGFGDQVTNICAGEGNPHRYGYFVEFKIKSHRNKYGIVHKDFLARCTDKKGSYWNTDIDVIYAGHLDDKKCKELFEPVWQAEFGS